MPAMDILQIKEFLPHRYPFLLVDRVLDYQLEGEEVSLTGLKNVSANEEFFNGHFPEHPIMPGVLILEAMAQAAGILGLHLLGENRTNRTAYYFAGSDKVRFKKPVFPGDQIILKAMYKSNKRGIWKFECHALVENEVVCCAELTCAEREI